MTIKRDRRPRSGYGGGRKYARRSSWPRHIRVLRRFVNKIDGCPNGNRAIGAAPSPCKRGEGGEALRQMRLPCPSGALKSRKRARCSNFRRPKASRRCGRRCRFGSLDSLGWRRRSGPGSLRYCSQLPCFVFFAQRRLAFRLLQFTLGSLPAFVLFAPQRGVALSRLSFTLRGLAAFVLFAPQRGLALSRLPFEPGSLAALLLFAPDRKSTRLNSSHG